MRMLRLSFLLPLLWFAAPVAAQQPATPLGVIAPSNTTGVLIKGAGGIIYGVQLYTINATPAYLKLYDKATAPTCGTDTPVKRLMIPAATTAANGGGSNLIFTPGGIRFNLGIGYCITTGIADGDTSAPTAANYLANIDWK